MPSLTGRLRHRVSLQAATITRDEFGGEIRTWAEVADLWADIEPLQGREFLEGRRQETELDTRIRIRYRLGVLPGMRIVWASAESGSRTYDIQSVIEHGADRRELRLMCRELGLDR